MNDEVRIAGIELENWRKHEHTDVKVGPGGLVARGRNRMGKTTLVKAVMAVATGDGATPDVIRHGAERAVATLRYTNGETARLVITPKGATCTVKNADGDTKSSPRKHLNALFGQSIDPCRLILAEPKERVAMVRAAIPCTVTADEIRAQWAPDLPADTNCTGHGLEVLARVHKWYYEKRTVANAAEKSARIEAERLAALVPAPVEGAPSIADAERAQRDAEAAVARLRTQDEQARKAIERTAGTRQRILELRNVQSANCVTPESFDEMLAAERSAWKAVADLKAKLAEAEDVHYRLTLEIEGLKSTIRKGEDAKREADGLEAALANAGPDPIAPEAIEAAERDVAATVVVVQTARDAEAARQAAAAADDAKSKHLAAKAEADRLDGIVKALADRAPRELIARSNGIEGLGFEDDEITLDGVRFGDGCSSADQVRIACEVSRRTSAKGRVFILDQFERLDVEQQELFKRAMVEHGWQLFAAMVDSSVEKGEIVIEAIGDESVEAIEAAE